MVRIDSELNQQLRELSGGEYGAWTALGIEILTEAVNNYDLAIQAPPPKHTSEERHTLRVPPELSASLKKIAAAEERMQKVVIGRMLKEGVEKRLDKKDEKKT